MKERLQKILSSHGICSRRKAEEYISRGRVLVNGVKASLGDSADIEKDIITFDGAEVAQNLEKIYIMLNKPKGYVTTMSDESGRADITRLISNVQTRVYPIGRLDMDSEGLLLLTNDGKFANMMMHPSHNIYKEYIIKISPGQGNTGKTPPHILLEKPMIIDGRHISPAKCSLVSQAADLYTVSISIKEGRNRQIRKMCQLINYEVHSLQRVAIGGVKLDDLPRGKWRTLTKGEVSHLKSLGRPAKTKK